MLSDLLGEGWASLQVRAVTFPAPPVKAKDTIYAEDCWSSNALEMGSDVFENKDNTVLASKFTNRGPAFVVVYDLGQLVSDYSNAVKLQVEATSIYCARIGYKKLFSHSNTIWATEANIEGLSLGTGSCHPASHAAVPDAPFLTTMLQMQRSVSTQVGTKLGNFKFATDRTAQKYFPEVDFSDNALVDHYIKMLGSKHIISLNNNTSLRGGLADSLIEQCMPTFNSNNRLWTKHKNNIVKIKSINKQLSKV